LIKVPSTRVKDLLVIGLSISGKMVDTVGRRLQRARQAKSLSVDEVAAATKIRPERIVDLEGDDLSHFPSLVYARSFLVKYARYLGVDIQDDLEQIQVGSTVGLGEYHYLQAAPPPKYLPEPRRREPSRPRLPVALLAILALVVLIGVPVIAFLAVNISRLNGGVPSADQAATESPSLDVKTTTPAKVAGTDQQTKEPARSVSPAPTASVSVVEATPSPSTAEEPNVVVRRALPVTPAEDIAQASPSPSSSATALETLEIRVRERTWLRVTKDKQNGEPIYNDFISPRSPPIVVQGTRFWLKLPDKNALELRKNGEAVAGPDNTIVIE
jgi:cytoskeletal protein RodZ